MRTDLDLGPLFRSTIGFDHMLDMLRNAARVGPADNDPPYDIERTSEDTYRLTLAVPGFVPEELSVTAQRNLLAVSGGKHPAAEEGSSQEGGARRHFLHRGIAARAFERRFELADHVKVLGANLAHGLLTIELRRELPEAMRPRRIEIGSGAKAAAPRQIEGKVAEERQAA